MHQTAATPTPVALSRLPSGARAVLHHAELPADQRAVLAAMGLEEGVTLTVVRGGDDCIVQVEAARLALAGAVAGRILVGPLDDGGPGP